MDSSLALRSLNGVTRSITNVQVPSIPTSIGIARRSLFVKRMSFFVSAAETTSVLTSDASQGIAHGIKERKSTFPNGFEALVLGVCDETDVAELKLKVGQFEMHMKRDIGSPASSTLIAPSVAPPAPPPVSSKPKAEVTSVAAKATPQKSSPFSNDSSSKASKLAGLEASGSYLLVSSPTVGTFRSGRTLKGKKQPPSCKEGDVIKEGQTIGFLDQFGSELPVKSSIAGEVLKFLCKDGEPVGFGDPLVAVLPSFHGIQ